MNEAERRFAAYLDSHGYQWSHEPDYQAEFSLAAPLATKPDFLVTREGSRAVAEVRQFESTRIRDRAGKPGGHSSSSTVARYGVLRSGIWEKAKQLRPFAGLGVPLVVVLANPLGADVWLDEHYVQAAMWGNPAFGFSIDTATGGLAEGRVSGLLLEKLRRVREAGPSG